ncbi:MAG: hypothetical protein IPO19_17430 [Rhodoferax sp.]|nr:hypothetical protein [Rhodoferax sp.]
MAPPLNAGSEVANVILDLVLRPQPSKEALADHPKARAHDLGRAAARRATVLAGSLALPPGALGWLTILPELIGVWKLQAQLVSDIASVYGKTATLNREQLLYCLFKHVSAQLFRDVVVRAGERVLIRSASLNALQALAQRLGLRIAHGTLGRGASRFVPLIGAIGVGAYAYYDTMQVAKTASELFARDIMIETPGVG